MTKDELFNLIIPRHFDEFIEDDESVLIQNVVNVGGTNYLNVRKFYEDSFDWFLKLHPQYEKMFNDPDINIKKKIHILKETVDIRYFGKETNILISHKNNSIFKFYNIKINNKKYFIGQETK